MTGLVTLQNQSLEDLLYRLSEAFRNMLYCKIVFVEFVWNKTIVDASLVEQPGCIGLFDFLCHDLLVIRLDFNHLVGNDEFLSLASLYSQFHDLLCGSSYALASFLELGYA